MAKLRIAFSGIGAVGGYYGGMVAARYQGTIKADIFFIARGENLKAIREKGLQMQLGIRTIHTAPALATDNPAGIYVRRDRAGRLPFLLYKKLRSRRKHPAAKACYRT